MKINKMSAGATLFPSSIEIKIESVSRSAFCPHNNHQEDVPETETCALYKKNIEKSSFAPENRNLELQTCSSEHFSWK